MTLNIKILESSLAKLKNHTVDFSASFYDKLFAVHPELKILFKNVELTAQEQKLMASLAVIVENLRNPEQLTLALRSLGAYHHEVGTIPEHYPFVGQALIETFAEYLGDEWNQQTEQAWLDAYNLISKIMLEGAQNPDRYLGGELTFYEWLDLYGESNPTIHKEIANTTHFKYRNYKAAHESS